MPEYTGAEFIARFLKENKIKYVFGIVGHGNATIVDAIRDMEPDVTFIPVKHEQWGGHMADGYFRANRKTPAVVTTSVGPGATNLATALATAFVDSSTFIAITGQIQTYLFGMGIFQEIERHHWVDYVNLMRHITKRSWLITNIRQLPRVLANAYKKAISGRPGPVLIDMPMDMQVTKLSGDIPIMENYMPMGRLYPDPDLIKKAAELLLNAERPLILIGGGATMSNATDELIKVAEFLDAPVVTSFRGEAKGAFPEDHELYAFSIGNIGSLVGNELAKNADVILAVGVTFSDETASSYRPGVTLNIPPTKLIHIDIDPHEIGKNYPVEVGIVADAKAALGELYKVLVQLGKKKENTAWHQRMKELKAKFLQEIEDLRAKAPMGIPNIVKLTREVLPRDAIITLSAGLPQEIFSQLWITYYPLTFISSGGFSTMGFALPAAIGAKLARPDKIVTAIEGDGSFLMNNVELSTAVQFNIPIIVIVLNNFGWISIRDLQIRRYAERIYATEFRKGKERYVIDFEKIVKAYGAEYLRAEDPTAYQDALRKAIKSEGVTVIEAIVETRFPYSGSIAYGYWDIPSPYVHD
ncbi:thiamine pyrophosphate-binding protein [Desulfurella sp.]|uniref:thiamine pyrophosphate-binding protein n=1 Tax=Desulfurella sp. TaxID=1962857 RepID=UPI0025C2C7FD|nr:thiamine pyrophosphate-binding protein [Desulfurella sp.]